MLIALEFGFSHFIADSISTNAVVTNILALSNICDGGAVHLSI